MNRLLGLRKIGTVALQIMFCRKICDNHSTWWYRRKMFQKLHKIFEKRNVR